MKLRILGCSGGIGRDLRTTSMLLDDDVLIDAGTGVGDLSIDELCRIDHVFVTHSHLDHVTSIPMLVDTVGWIRGKPITVHAIEPTLEILRSHDRGTKLIFVGDASMSPYEIEQPGGSVEHWNDEPGRIWLRRLFGAYPKAVWLNPEPEEIWSYRQSIGIMRELMGGRMHPTTIEGLERAMRYLSQGSK